MKNTLKIVFIICVVLVLTGLCTLSEAETSGCGRCDDVAAGSPQEVRIEYKDGTARSACGLRCAGAMLAAYRMQDVKTIWVREHGSGKLLDAKKAFWSLGPATEAGRPFQGNRRPKRFQRPTTAESQISKRRWLRSSQGCSTRYRKHSR